MRVLPGAPRLASDRLSVTTRKGKRCQGLESDGVRVPRDGGFLVEFSPMEAFDETIGVVTENLRAAGVEV